METRMKKLIGAAALIGAAILMVRERRSDAGAPAAVPMHQACASMLVRMTAAARERGAAHSFAAVIRAATGVPGWFSIQELSDRLDTPEGAIRGWCDPARAPQAVLRDYVFDELLAVLAETIG